VPPSPLNKVIEHLCRTVLLREGHELTDAELLERFVSQHEDAAIEILVCRHGPMVAGVCHRLLRNHHDAEDAFQATFLVLVRRAASISRGGLLANWLYGVAHQTALKSRQTAAKRARRERQVADMPEPAAAEPGDWHDLHSILDQELSRLPDKYRAAIVLCDLEGKARKEAAQELGVPEGTVASRLARARQMLAKRLARHGLALSATALAATLTKKAAAAIPAATLSTTIKAVTLVAAGQTTGLVSVNVAALAEGVIQAMFLSKLMRMTVVLLVLGVLAFGGGLVQHQMAAGQADALVQKSKNKGAKGSKAETELQTEVEKLRLELDAALLVIQKMKDALGQGAVPQDQGPLYRGRPVRFWMNQLKDADSQFRVEAVEALGSLARQDKELIRVVAGVLKDQDVVEKAARSLGYLGPEAVPALLDVLKDQTSATGVRGAANAVAMIGPKAKAAVPLLAQTLKMNDDWARREAVYALIRIGPEAKAAIPAMIDAIGDYLKSTEQLAKKEKVSASIILASDGSLARVIVDAISRFDPEIKDIVSAISKLTPNTPEEETLRVWQRAYDALKKKYQK
jgi:RNA polymerase sigma factor (sigma-70 family)